VNGRCVETCVNIKLPFFLHVPILFFKISFNIVGHGMDLILEVFATMFANPTYLHIYDNEYDGEEVNEGHYKKPWVVDMCELMRPDDTSPMWKKKITTNLQVHPPSWKKHLLKWVP
jgi:hypothetical protein